MVAGGTAAAVLTSLPATYTSETRLLVGPLTRDFDALRASEALATTYAEIATSDLVIAEAVESSGLDLEPDDVSDDVSAVTVGTSRVLLVTVTRPRPEQARELARGIAAAVQTEAPDGGAELTVIEPASSAQRVSQRVPLLVALAAVAGATLAGAALTLSASPTARRRT